MQETHAKVMCKSKAMRTMVPKDVPLLLAIVGGKRALPMLEGADLLETLVACGVDCDRAKAERFARLWHWASST